MIASGACTDSSMNRIRFEGLDYAPVADFGLLRAAYDAARGARRRRRARRADLLQRLVLPAAARAARRGWSSYGVLAVEMEASALYTLAASTAGGRWRSAPSPTTSSPARRRPPQEREQTFGAMVEIALDAALATA